MMGSIRTLSGVLVLTTLFCGVSLSPRVARADHDSYEYSGPRYGFHGETHLIAALGDLELAFYADDGAHRMIRTAKRHIRYARANLCSRHARYFLRGALDHLFQYTYGHHTSDLDDAARLVTKALMIERATHAVVHPQVVHHPPSHHRGHHGSSVRINHHGVGISWGRGGLFVHF